MTAGNDWAKARRRIAAERAARTGRLDLSHLAIDRLPSELSELFWLRELDCSFTQVNSLAGLEACANLATLNCSRTEISSLAGLEACANLATLDCSGTQIGSLAGLEACANLATLKCSRTEISSFAGLEACANLATLDCSGTEISSLAGLEACANLATLKCWGTQISSLAGLEACANLTELKCWGTQISSLAGLEACANLTELKCWGTQISSLAGLEACANLATLDCSGTEISSLAGLEACANLATLKCSHTEISSLAGLEACANLATLDCSGTEISSLAGLEACANLATLECSHTQISSLAGLEACANLATLNCSGTQISSLAGLEACVNLATLNCSYTQISSLAGLEACAHLATLNCSYTQISSLAGLEACANLATLKCSYTQISSLAGLEACAHLATLDCSGAQISSLAGLDACANLATLECSYTEISSLAGLEACANLATLVCSGCDFEGSEEAFWDRPLVRVVFRPGRLFGVPSAILSESYDDNCLLRLREHFRALKAGTVRVRTAKLFVLGNGAVGKTQLGRRLRGEPYDPGLPTTHGVDIHRFELPAGPGDPIILNHWDFGGQPLYHGAHALFLRDRAIYLLAWSPGSEDGTHVDTFGVAHPNHPLAYWLAYARAAAGRDSALLVVQTRCDPEGAPQAAPPVDPKALDGFAYEAPWQAVSALNGTGFAGLRAELAQAAARVLERRGYAEISVLWAAVIDRIAALRPVDSGLHPGRKSARLEPGQVRTLTPERLGEICRECGLDVGHDTLLHYLNATGEVFHRAGHFDDQVIIDQNWILDAIYAVFERSPPGQVGCRERLHDQQGRFTARDLAAWLWDARGFTPDDQALFIGFMQSCGVCFPLYDLAGERNYIAPSALPDLDHLQIAHAHAWQEHAPPSLPPVTYAFEYFHDGVLHALLSRLGHRLRLRAAYWRDGVLVPGEATGVRARLHVVRGQGHAAEIVIEAQASAPGHPEAAEIAHALCEHVDEVILQTGLMAVRSPATPRGKLVWDNAGWDADGEPPATPVAALLAADPPPSTPPPQPPAGGYDPRVPDLVRRLGALRPAQFQVVVLSLQVPPGQQPRDNVTLEEQAVTLVRWAIANAQIVALQSALEATERPD
jgi:internalin A